MPDGVPPTTATQAPIKISIRRSIVIGLGGTGRKVCTELKRILLESNGNDPERFPHVKILSIDSAKRAEKVTQQQTGDIVSLSLQEMLSMSIPPESHARLGAFVPSYLRNKLVLANDYGAGGCRPIGHAFLVTNWILIRDRIKGLHKNLITANLEAQLGTDPTFRNLEFTDRRVDIYVIGNLVSGTGSGMALGMGYLLQDLIGEIGADRQHHVEGVFTVCGAYNQGDNRDGPSPHAVNCYAALLELNHYFKTSTIESRDNQYKPGYSDIQLRWNLDRPPYNHVQLLCPSHVAAGEINDEELNPLIASVLALRTGSLVGMIANERIVDPLIQGGTRDRRGRVRFCYAWGGATLRASSQSVLDLTTALVADTVLDAMEGPYMAGGVNPKAEARQIALKIGFGYTDSEDKNTDLLKNLLIPKVALKGLAINTSVLDSIPSLIANFFPAPVNDPEIIKQLPTKLDVTRNLLEQVSQMIDAVTAHNLERLTPMIKESVFKQIEDLADFSTDGRGSVDTAIKTIEHLVRRDIAAPGILRNESAAYQASATQLQTALREAKDRLESAVNMIKAMAGTRSFNYAAVQTAWTNMIQSMIELKGTEAKLKALKIARTILDGDDQDAKVEYRTGLIDHLEDLSKKLTRSRDHIGRLEKMFEDKQERIKSRFDAAERASIADQAEKLKDELLQGQNLPVIAGEIVSKIMGKPYAAWTHYSDRAVIERDYGLIESMMREKVKNQFGTELSKSIANNPTFNNKLNDYLGRAAPAIRLYVTSDNPTERAYFSVPPEVVPFEQAVRATPWYTSRPDFQTQSELFTSRPGDNEPRVDLLVYKDTFSPASVVGIGLWADSYARRTSTLENRRGVHTLSDYGAHKGLFFENLVDDEYRTLSLYFVGRSLLWLRQQDDSTVVLPAKGGGENIAQFLEQNTLLTGVLGTDTFLKGAFVDQIGNQESPAVNIDIRLQQLMRGEDQAEQAWAELALTIGLAQLIFGDGELSKDRVLPTKTDPDRFACFDKALQGLLNPLGLYNKLIAKIKIFQQCKVSPMPSLGDVDSLPNPIKAMGTPSGFRPGGGSPVPKIAPQPGMYPPGTYAMWDPQAQAAKIFMKEQDGPLAPGRYRMLLPNNEWGEEFVVDLPQPPPPVFSFQRTPSPPAFSPSPSPSSAGTGTPEENQGWGSHDGPT